MRKMLAISLTCIAFVLCVSLAQATSLPRIMIVGEDENTDTIPSDNQVFERILRATSNRLIESGFDVRDESALTLDTHDQSLGRRSDAELVRVAKDTGIDVLVLLSLYPRVKSSAGATRVTVRASGRLLSVSDGRRMGNFEAEPMKYQLVEQPANRSNILAAAGKIAKVIGYEVADVLNAKLENYQSGPEEGKGYGGRVVEWTLVFDNFTVDEMSKMEDYLVRFSGYKSHRPKSNAMNTNRHHEYWYRSNIHESKMRNNMYKLLDKLGLKGRVQIAGKKVKVSGVSSVKQKEGQGDGGW